MAGFRIGRGRDNRSQGPRPQQHPQQQPYGQNPPYGGPPAPPYPQQQWPPAGGAPHGGPGGHRGGHGGGAHGEPEYFGDPHQQPPYPQQGAPHDPFAANNNPGHTQAFSFGEDPYSQGDTYRAGAAAAPAGPRLHWKELLSGIVMRPGPTFLQMRDHSMWGPALIVTFIYGLLAVFGFDNAREDAINATLATSVPIVLTTGVAIVISALMLGAVTHTLARQLGGDGAWQPTVGLSMLIMSITDAPRLVFAMFLGGDAPLVQILGWATWVAAGALFTTMVSKSHDLAWPKALAASAIQLLALLSIIKLGTF
ncbi:Yip1 family protein [Streptomyces luteolus]|uniref:Yip1 family protein n=1 Tax=Streptomyces luteolus TaxID=3043615 RepID=A0ABT6T8E1_9ACTN|nr:Yip1 family protein [Streptomyces sp. B-S-A12]MDI3424162.1 Yip1 family protein [Streptomyces sp. B-S-A12]